MLLRSHKIVEILVNLDFLGLLMEWSGSRARSWSVQVITDSYPDPRGQNIKSPDPEHSFNWKDHFVKKSKIHFLFQRGTRNRQGGRSPADYIGMRRSRFASNHCWLPMRCSRFTSTGCHLAVPQVTFWWLFSSSLLFLKDRIRIRI
jgi:hypothetical protein